MVKFPEPPESLTFADEDFVDLSTGTLLWRIHRTLGDWVVPWNQLRMFGPIAARFDPHLPPPHDQDRGVTYTTTDVPTALAEVFQRTRVCNRRAGNPYLTGWRLARDVQLLDLSGTWPVRNGASFAINTGPHRRCQRWIRRVLDHHPRVAGVRSQSAMTGSYCAALFMPAADSFPDRPEISLPLFDPRLGGRLTEAAALIGYRVI